MKGKWQVENNEFCVKVLNKHWPDVPKFGDIRNVGRKELAPVDLIAGGFPCQPFSVAGKRRGTEDDRHLWPEMLRIISELKPAWVLGENVPGIIPIFFDQAVSDLEAEGYTCEAFVLPAAAFDAPHRRDRLFIVAYSSNRGFSQPNSNKSSNSGGNNQALEQSGENFKGLSSSDSKVITNPSEIRCKRGFNIGKERQIQENKVWNDQKNNKVRKGWKSIFGKNGYLGFVANSKIIKGHECIDEGSSEPQGSTQEFRDSNRKNNSNLTRWSPEPRIRRVDARVPRGVDRLAALGNAVVPQVAEHIGKIILQADKKMSHD